jgi:hypothetical protein
LRTVCRYPAAGRGPARARRLPYAAGRGLAEYGKRR